MMDIANDNQAVAALPKLAWDSVLPPEFREMLDQRDRSGSAWVCDEHLPCRLYESGFEKTDRTERILTAVRNLIERHR